MYQVGMPKVHKLANREIHVQHCTLLHIALGLRKQLQRERKEINLLKVAFALMTFREQTAVSSIKVIKAIKTLKEGGINKIDKKLPQHFAWKK